MALPLTDLFSPNFLSSSEYMSDEQSMIILGDSISALKAMESNSVDLVFADPPYNLGKDFGVGSDCWDSADDYIQWCKEWILECMRVLKPNGTIYVMAATQYMPLIDVFVSSEFSVLSRIVWAYDSSGVQSKKMFGSLYEPILMFAHNGVTSKDITFNAKDIMVEAKTGSQRKLIDYRKNPPQPYNTKKVPGNVWEFPRVRYRMEEYENHPSQKPEALLERVILASSNEDDIVLDPFGGSFSTAGVARKLGRRAISVDINPDYFKIGLRRAGLAKEYKGEILRKDKGRKTRNKSKKDHEPVSSVIQESIF